MAPAEAIAVERANGSLLPDPLAGTCGSVTARGAAHTRTQPPTAPAPAGAAFPPSAAPAHVLAAPSGALEISHRPGTITLALSLAATPAREHTVIENGSSVGVPRAGQVSSERLIAQFFPFVSPGSESSNMGRP